MRRREDDVVEDNVFEISGRRVDTNFSKEISEGTRSELDGHSISQEAVYCSRERCWRCRKARLYQVLAVAFDPTPSLEVLRGIPHGHRVSRRGRVGNGIADPGGDRNAESQERESLMNANKRLGPHRTRNESGRWRRDVVVTGRCDSIMS